MPKLNRALIAQAVLRVGFEDLTTALVAQNLGVAAGGLYRYVDDRDDLVIAAIDHAFAEMPFSQAARWQDYLRDEAWLRWEVITAHPGMIQALRSTGRSAGATMVRYRHCADALVRFGLAAPDAFLAVDMIVDLVNDASQQHGALQSVVDEDRLDAFMQRQLENLGEQWVPVLRGIVLDSRAFFARKLDVAVYGLETTVQMSAS